MADVRLDHNGVPKGAVIELTAPAAHRSAVTAADGAEPGSVASGVNAEGYQHVDFDVDVALGGTAPMVEVAPLFYDATAATGSAATPRSTPRAAATGCAWRRGAAWSSCRWSR